MTSFRIPLASTLILLPTLLLIGCSGRDANNKPGQTRGDQRIQPVEVVKLTRQDLAESLAVVGSLAPNESADIRPEIAGLVKAIHFEEGMSVTTGQLLVKIDDSELSAQAAQSEARFNLARLNLERAENLRKTQSNTQADVDRAQSEFSSAKAELALLRLRIEKTEIRAPFDGIVGSRTVSVGDYVNTQSSITTIDDLSRLKVDFQVPERALDKIHRGTRFSLASNSQGGEPVMGEVYFVSSVIDRNTRSSQVKGLLDTPPSSLKPGMFANIDLVLDIRKGVLTVPEAAILTTSSGSSLILARQKDGQWIAEFKPVRLGLRARGFVEIDASEISENDTVVASGVGGLILYPGAKLEPRPAKTSFRPDNKEVSR